MKRESRANKREHLEQAAASMSAPAEIDLAIVGGGPAALVAAILAAEAGLDTWVFERELSFGKTILKTGAGRCNFSNTELSFEAYNNPAFVHTVFGDTPLDDILAFFHETGLAWTIEEDRLYPRSMQAASIRELLLARAESAGVHLITGRSCENVAARDDSFELVLKQNFGNGELEHTHVRALILASGAGAKGLTQELELNYEDEYGVLTGIEAIGLPFEKLDGRRSQVNMKLYRGEKLIHQESGELLFRSWGLSGIVSFNCSRFTHAGDTLVLDLAEELSEGELQELYERSGSYVGVLDPVIAEVLRRGDLPPKQLKLEVLCLSEQLEPQIIRGGLSCENFAPSTLMARELPGLFACGEILNIDGPCGGFNLSWAWKSAMIAASSVISYLEAHPKRAV